MKKKLVVVLLVLLFYSVYFAYDYLGISVIGATILETANEIPAENGPLPLVYFCPQDKCSLQLIELIDKSENVSCAFYDLDINPVIKALSEKNARVIVDNDNYEPVEEQIELLKQDDREALMHNKFCVFDNSMVWTGSFNPTENGDLKNNNNVIVIESEYLAANYMDEFEEMWNGEFGRAKKVKNPKILFNEKKIVSAFCPEDNCEEKVLEVLYGAKESIYFMTFSFTSDPIGKVLVEKHIQGIDVRGVFEKRQNSKYSEFSRLNESGIAVQFDSNPAMMHHKVFIIDGKVVVTGSYNPTANGNKNNDENILIIEDRTIASEFLEEFEKNYLIN